MKRILAVVALVALAACSSTPSNKIALETKNMSAREIYQTGMDVMADGDFEKAIKYFEMVEARYPYGSLAAQAQLETAYAWYKQEDPASAIAAADRFIKLHPNHPHVDYAYYLKGLANFNDGSTFLNRVSHQDVSERDPKAAAESFAAFRELVTRFPNSRYTPDALKRMKFLVNTLAEHELHVARYYMRRQAYVAAAARARYVVENYPEAKGVEEALAIMVKAYGAMGMTDLQKDALRVLQKNYPHSAYLDAASLKKSTHWWKFW